MKLRIMILESFYDFFALTVSMRLFPTNSEYWRLTAASQAALSCLVFSLQRTDKSRSPIDHIFLMR